MNNDKKGIILTISGGVAWGLSGVSAQYLFAVKELNAQWLVTMRLIMAGIIMLIVFFSDTKSIKSVFGVFGDKKDIIRIIIFGIIGMAVCQLSYFVTIEKSNAGTATVLQYTAPVIIMLYLSVKNKTVPSPREIAALFFVVLGTFFLASHGNVHSLAISKEALMWGLFSAVTVVFYNLLPVKLMNKFGTLPVLGWGMITGGIFMTIMVKPWIVPGIWDIKTLIGFGAVIIVGTAMAFGMYLEGVRLIGAKKASMFASSEPLTSTAASAVFMNVAFQGMDIAGLICILFGVSLLTFNKK
ncbi:MAG: DMT family transporter [Clostridia bacterium]|nr:DMT family transporter [Clostridia bacterium]